MKTVIAFFRLNRRLFSVNNLKKKMSTASQSSNSFGFGLWARYLKLLEERPMLTKSITSGVISFSADAICQYGEYRNRKKGEDKSFDFMRSGRFTLLGAALVGPTLHVWYGYLARLVPGTLVVDALKRLALDQVIFAPLFIPVFFFANLLLEGRPDTIMEKVERDLTNTLITNYAVWIPAQFLNFFFMPPSLQVLFSNSVGFFWNIYFSYMANKSIISESDEVDEVDSSSAMTAVNAEVEASTFSLVVEEAVDLHSAVACVVVVSASDSAATVDVVEAADTEGRTEVSAEAEAAVVADLNGDGSTDVSRPGVSEEGEYVLERPPATDAESDSDYGPVDVGGQLESSVVQEIATDAEAEAADNTSSISNKEGYGSAPVGDVMSDDSNAAADLADVSEVAGMEVDADKYVSDVAEAADVGVDPNSSSTDGDAADRE